MAARSGADGGHMSRLRVLAALLTACLSGLFLHTPSSGTTLPDAEVRISAQAYEGPRGTILASLRARCAPGFEVADLVIQFSQGDVSTPPRSAATLPCDGEWHRQSVSSDEAFEPGKATMTALLSVTDAETGEPGDPAFVVQEIYVRPAARIWLPRYAVLKANGVVRLVVYARCDAPWVLQDFLVDGTQGGLFDSSPPLPIVCDGEVRPVTVWLSPEGAAFRRGGLLVNGALSLLDPEFFDPVTTATATRWITVL